MARILISGYIGFSNFGDDAILSSLVNYLKKSGNYVMALSSNPDLTTKMYTIDAYKFNNIFQVINSIKSADMLISGGGSLLQNATSNKSLIYYLMIILLARIFSKRIVIFAQGIGPIKGEFFQAVTKYVLGLVDVVTVRNSFSQRLLNRWGIKSELVCDPVWNIPVPEHTPKGIIGVQLRPYEFMHKDFIQNLANAIWKNYSDKKIQIFPFQKNLDEDVCQTFLNALKAKNPSIEAEIIPYKSIEKTKEDFANLDVLLAMRFHACLLGLKMGIKTLPLSYDEKVVNLAQDFKIEYVDVQRRVNVGNFVADFEKEYGNNAELGKINKIKFDWSYFAPILGDISEGVEL